VLLAGKDYPAARELLKAARRQHPHEFWIHFGLGFAALDLQQRPDRAAIAAAVNSYRTALALRPDSALAHNNLGQALYYHGDLDEAVACFRKATALDPGSYLAWHNLGATLSACGEQDEAIACLRKALVIEPKSPIPLAYLGQALLQRGDLTKARNVLRRATEALPANNSLCSVAAAQLLRCQRLLKLEPELPATLGATAPTMPPADAVELAFLYARRGRLTAACRLYAEAFAADSRLAKDQWNGYRLLAAAAAARAAAGAHAESARLDEATRAALRRQALAWLREDLAAWDKRFTKAPAWTAPDLREALVYWLYHCDLASVRDPDALARLPAEERADWRQLWRDVTALRDRAARQ
jgi:Flp pilus assembly protein TadD